MPTVRSTIKEPNLRDYFKKFDVHGEWDPNFDAAYAAWKNDHTAYKRYMADGFERQPTTPATTPNTTTGVTPTTTAPVTQVTTTPTTTTTTSQGPTSAPVGPRVEPTKKNSVLDRLNKILNRYDNSEIIKKNEKALYDAQYGDGSGIG